MTAYTCVSSKSAMSRKCRSRRQPLASPGAVGLARVKDAVVQTAGPALPQFDRVRHHAHAAPMLRPRHRTASETPLEFREQLFEFSARRERLALLRHPRADLRLHRPSAEIRLALFGTGPLDDSLDPHLPLQRLPKKTQRRPRIGGQLFPFAAVIIRMKREPPRVEALEQYDPRRRTPVRSNRGER